MQTLFAQTLFTANYVCALIETEFLGQLRYQTEFGNELTTFGNDSGFSVYRNRPFFQDNVIPDNFPGFHNRQAAEVIGVVQANL